MDELRKAFNEAWDESEEAEAETGAEGTEGLAEETSEASTTENLDDDDNGSSTEGTGDSDQELPDKQEVQGDKDTESSTEAAPAESSDKTSTKAPASWTPAARESWAKIPASAQAQIAKREAQMTTHMQNTSEATKAIKQFKSVMDPYTNSMMAAGVTDPFKVVSTLMSNDNIMRHGQAQDKVNLVASMIDRFQIDVTMLDSVLTGQPQTGEPRQNGQMQDLIREEMAPFRDMMRNQEVSRQNQEYDTQQTAISDVATFSKDKEFFEDVRGTMADFVDMASARGQTMTMDQAYAKACALDPEISKIMASRAVTTSIMGKNQSAQNKLNAASSITGSRAGLNTGGSSDLSLRDQIAANWDEARG